MNKTEMMPVLIRLLAILTIIGRVRASYDQSIESCRSFAGLFDQTCAPGPDFDVVPSSVSAMIGQEVICYDKKQCIDGGETRGNDCYWVRKLCVTCKKDNENEVKIRIQTNNLPNHCVKTTSIIAKNFDYEIVFNKKMPKPPAAVNYPFTATQLKNNVCPIKKGWDTLPYYQSVKVIEKGDEENEMVMAYALNGVTFQFANTQQDDPIFPKNVTNEQPLDVCLGHNQLNSKSGMYHYHELSPCINKDFLQSVSNEVGINGGNAACEDTVCGNCNEITCMTNWKLKGYETWDPKKPVGMSKDGHVMYGPYDNARNLWKPGVVDPCNGSWSDDEEEFFYVNTRWHPYLVGCMGSSTFSHVEDSPPIYPMCGNNGIENYHDNDGPTSAPSPRPDFPVSFDSYILMC